MTTRGKPAVVPTALTAINTCGLPLHYPLPLLLRRCKVLLSAYSGFEEGCQPVGHAPLSSMTPHSYEIDIHYVITSRIASTFLYYLDAVTPNCVHFERTSFDSPLLCSLSSLPRSHLPGKQEAFTSFLRRGKRKISLLSLNLPKKRERK